MIVGSIEPLELELELEVDEELDDELELVALELELAAELAALDDVPVEVPPPLEQAAIPAAMTLTAAQPSLFDRVLFTTLEATSATLGFAIA